MIEDIIGNLSNGEGYGDMMSTGVLLHLNLNSCLPTIVAYGSPD